MPKKLDLGFILKKELNPDELLDILTDEIFPSDDKKPIQEQKDDVLPLMTLRNAVLFPGVVIPISIGRSKTTKLIKQVEKSSELFAVVTQKDSKIEEPDQNDLYEIGTLARVINVMTFPDKSTTVLIQGLRRFHLDSIVETDPFLKARVTPIENPKIPKDKAFSALLSSIKDTTKNLTVYNDTFSIDNVRISSMKNSITLINYIASSFIKEATERQKLLEILDVRAFATTLLSKLGTEEELAKLKRNIEEKVKLDLDKQQREYFLNQQIRTIQEELGGAPNEKDVAELKQKATKKKWSAKMAEVFEKELAKLQRMNPQVADYGVQHNYLEYLVELPWNEYTKDNFNLKHAQNVLDKDHYGLEKVKERIIEFLAVLKIKKDMKSPILCLVGPPGVGKTSLGKSIAKALGRNYVRMSLGGLRDESELRGHRKTYIGAMPGRIIQNLRKAKSDNPVFVLDEIDKVSGNNVNGDPQAALLEILDPEQNTNFNDNFIEQDYDLSKVLFIATANNLSSIHPALLDRMEIIDINGYLREEKYEIAKRHLLPKQLTEHGLTSKDLLFSQPVIMQVIDDYTHEAGVRTLERKLATIIRKKAKKIAMNEEYEKKISAADVRESLGLPLRHDDEDIVHTMPGVAVGLAWTSVGGEILSIEVSMSRGNGALHLTGQLGDVMKESATIAYEFIKAHTKQLNLDANIFDEWNVHIHVPEGATPKDGPSAGITILTALTSAFTQRRVIDKMAMTGEITLRGRVLPVGGIKEKILGAKRNGITHVIMSKENERDLEEIKKEYLEGMTFSFTDNMLEVLSIALAKEEDHNALDYNKFLFDARKKVTGFRSK